MAFEEIAPAEVAVSSHTGAAVSLVKIKGSVAKLRVILRRAVIEAMGFADDERLVVLLGLGDDHGIVRLRKDKAGKFKLSHRAAAHGAEYWAVNLGHRTEFVDRTEKAQPCQWEKVDLVTVEIIMPDWADVTKPKPSAKASATPPEQRAAKADAERRAHEAQEAQDRRAERDSAEEGKEWDRVKRDLVSTAPILRFDSDLNITATQGALLAILVDKAGQVVSREAMLTLLYSDQPDDPPDIKVLDVWICKLRPKLRLRGVSIATVHGVGYRLTGDVSALLAKVAA